MENSILIIKTGALGDVLRTTTLLQELKRKYKDARISWLANKGSKEILLNNSLIERIYTIEKVDELPKEFDYVISLDDEPECAEIATLLKKRKLIGAYTDKGIVRYTEDSSAWFGMGLLRADEEGGLEEANRLKKANKRNFHQLMAEICGVDYKQEEPILYLTKEEMEFGKRFARKNRIKKNMINKSDLVIGLNTGAGRRWGLKRWQEKKTAQLADDLIEKLGAKIVLMGGEQEKERNERIKELSRNNLIDAGTENTIRQFASIINLCDILVSSDTLAMYIAIALKKKLVVLIGPTSAAEIELYSRGKKLYADMPCICCYKKQCSMKPNCMDMLSVENVFNAVKELMI